jgi:putative secretion ATPase (PEP-CTERM system associated)
MYEQFYGFKEKPFTLLPDPSFLYLGKKHSMAFSMLEYGLLSQAGFTVITGEVGSGKTTLIRHLLDQMEDDINIGLVNSSHRDMGELLRWILLAFGLEYQDKDKVSLHDKFAQFLIEQYSLNKRTVLIIDEAQNLETHVLEELRLLSNINADKDQVLQVILVGQPELRSLLKRPSLLQFLQRVSVDYHLAGLSEEETIAYINHRTRRAGSEKSIFTDSACSLIFKASKGIPRVINTLCDTSLVYGYSDQKTSIDDELVKSVLADKAESGLLQISTEEEEQQPVVVPNHGNQSNKKTNAASATQFDTEMAKQLFTSLSINKK